VVHTNAGLYMIDYRSIKSEDMAKLEKLKASVQKDHPKVEIELISSNLSFKSYVEELAAKKKIHYVVIGLESKSKLSKFIWGTSGIDIAGKIDCPVIIVPEKYKRPNFQRMLTTVDYKQELKQVVIRKAEKFAREHKMAFDLVHFQTDEELTFGLEVAQQLKEADKWNIKTIRSKNFTDGVKKYVSQNKIDLVVLFSRPHSLVYKLFNESNTKTITFNSNVPVMSIHG